MLIESVHLENYRSFADATLGGSQGLPRLAVLVGANGSGKSTFFDALSFLRDALDKDVPTAVMKRGGMKEVRSRGKPGPVVIEIKFREDGPGITYRLEVDEQKGKPVVSQEKIIYRHSSRSTPWHFLDFSGGHGIAARNPLATVESESDLERDEYTLDQPGILAIKHLGQMTMFPALTSVRRLIEGWHLSNIHIDHARHTDAYGVASSLTASGDNILQYAAWMHQEHPGLFQKVCDALALWVPGLEHVRAEQTIDGRMVLRFKDGSFQDPFLGRSVSDGTIKLFTYLMLLHDPNPHTLLAIEEPENQLYPSVLSDLAETMRAYSGTNRQVFVSTHSPDFLNALRLEEVFQVIRKDGYSTIRPAIKDEQLQALTREGDLLGFLWRQGLFLGVDPR
ncbi:MAG: chromosome segregation protein SMC [Planctomycetota bacterium]|nr:MAG: chromosome segregation protein SMC [Planctomycetota bacterium]